MWKFGNWFFTKILKDDDHFILLCQKENIYSYQYQDKDDEQLGKVTNSPVVGLYT